MEALTLRVRQDGTGDYGTIAAALEAVSARGLSRRGPVTLDIGNGEWREKLRLSEPDLTLRGVGANQTKIVWNDHATKPLGEGETFGTFNSYTVYVGAAGCALQNLTIENDAGDGRSVGQAVALYADADRFRCERCTLVAHQDTLCTGPLPKNPVPKGINLIHPVAGLGNHEPRLPYRQRYTDCRIAGDIDFIFGSALALFEGCEIHSLDRKTENSYIAAPSTYPGQKAGFVFHRCKLTSDTARPSVWLCRPWRATARCAYISCDLGPHILDEGWHDWDKPEAHVQGVFIEASCFGPGADATYHPDWVRQLSDAEGRRFLDEVRELFR